MDGRKIFIEHSDIITPGMKKRIEGEGLTYKEGHRGDLIIEFTIKFPSLLSDERKRYLKKLLPRNKNEVSSDGCDVDTLTDIDIPEINTDKQEQEQEQEQEPQQFPPELNCAQQ